MDNLEFDYANDTIAAIATAPGQGAVGIVRLSGIDAVACATRIIDKMYDKPHERLESHRMYYGKIYNNGEVIDEVMYCVMRAPKSYTREDIVEIYCHGGMLTLRAVLGTVLAHGARIAEPGEFTKRAFLNGRINLSQAEAVMDIISAGSEAARRIGLAQLGGAFGYRISALRDKILTWLAHIELSIDYPEHEDEAKNSAEILTESGEVLAEIGRILNSAKTGRVLRDGIKTAIIGRPNVGKSTLLNAILSEERAIVHEMAGTTRDVLTERVLVNDVPLILMDTAGIHETDDTIEKIGVEKSVEAAENAELILYVVDAQTGMTAEDEEFMARIDGCEIIIVLNKCDIKQVSVISNTEVEVIKISAKTGEGLSVLYSQIHEKFLSGINTTADDEIITRERHRTLLEKAIFHIKNAVHELQLETFEDLVSIELRAAYIALGEILGLEVEDDIIDRIFAEFCLGK